MTLKPLDLKKR